MRNVSQGSPPEPFDPQLGNFMKNTFVLELEYMFVQVRAYHEVHVVVQLSIVDYVHEIIIIDNYV